MLNLIFIAFLSFDNSTGQFLAETSQFKNCLHFVPNFFSHIFGTLLPVNYNANLHETSKTEKT